MVDKNIIEYRKEHHKCKYCSYSKYVPYNFATFYGGNIIHYPAHIHCILKDQDFKINKLAFFCDYYNVSEDKISI